MDHTKRTTRRISPPRKRAKSVGGMKFASPSSLVSPLASPASVRQVAHFIYRMVLTLPRFPFPLQAASVSWALADGHTTLHRRT
ncbi:hypothetical protein LIER_19371 [Lithospermum erythrorhizon]|uniref:Uncharacterized protein n=1 Tax=Lithospermum erythrorhizon TaxID=34254 RepID=A0AAV3QHJ9_LITER